MTATTTEADAIIDDIWSILFTPEEAAALRERSKLVIDILQMTEKRLWTTDYKCRVMGLNRMHCRMLRDGRISLIPIKQLREAKLKLEALEPFKESP